jgi:circadian clock protein KaiB
MKKKKVSQASPVRRRKSAKLWQLRLYVTDQTPRSKAAFSNLKKVCEIHLKGLYRITVIDLLKHPQLAKGDQILAVPTLVRQLPIPIRTIIGNLSDIDNVIVGLELRASAARD